MRPSDNTEPGYVSLFESGELARRAEVLQTSLAECTLCPRRCGANRSSGETGVCGAGEELVVAAACPHHGEEPPISATLGSGTIFFAFCPVRCVYCQNYRISHDGVGTTCSEERLADRMLDLQANGCHNINLVTATQFLPQIMSALASAVPRGLRIPIVYNTGGYERVETIRMLEGLVDIYLPDVKFATDPAAAKLTVTPDYASFCWPAVHEMYRQTGPLEIDDSGVAHRGTIVRHLVLPGGFSETAEVLRRLKREIGTDVHLSLMGQYLPRHRAIGHPAVGRKLLRSEYETVVDEMHDLGFFNGWCQDVDSLDGGFVPDFDSPTSVFRANRVI